MTTDRRTRIVRRPLPWDLQPSEALRLLRSDRHPVALFGSWAGGSDIIASEPTRTRTPPSPLDDVTGGLWPVEPANDPGCRQAAFGGGWIGYLGFALAEETLPAPPAPGDPRRLPAWWFGFYDHVLRRDRATGTWAFEALWTPSRSDALARRFEELATRTQTVDVTPHAFDCGTFALNVSEAEHQSAVRRAIDYIRRGDIVQANICLRLETTFTGDPLDAFTRAAALLEPPYAAFLQVPGGAVASLSPELFLHRTGTTVLTRPIKGTTRRSDDDPRGANRQRDVLLGSDKDRAENVMIVDLMRNDLSRACTAGSVTVPRLLDAEAHPGLWHLVSDVQGTLLPGAGDRDLLAATFPPGSVTGAPKVRAAEIIHELETAPREIYTGAIGYRSPLAGLEMNVAIRTFEFHDDRVWLGSGGGITVRSDPADEYRECLVKAAPLVQALGATLDVGHPPPSAHAYRPTAPRDLTPRPATQTMRPRPAAGVFTSLTVNDGHARSLDQHLERLQASTRTLFGKDLPDALRQQLYEIGRAHSSGRLRITATPIGGPLQTTVEVVATSPTAASLNLDPVTVPGGLGAHKWWDRRLLAKLTVTSGPDNQLLLRDADGQLLETDRANLFIVIDNVLYTPPTDGRILPGITRAAVLQIAAVTGITAHEMSFTLPQLTAADEVFVTNSGHGITPVHGVTGTDTTWQTGPVTTHLTKQLAERPTGAVHPPASSRSSSALGRVTSQRHDRPVIVLIDNYDSFTYNLVHLLDTQNCQVEVIRNDETSADDIAAFSPDGIVISPGPCTPAEAGISIDTILACAATIPILGVCLGHQAIAVAYGGHLERSPEPVHGSGSRITHDTHGLFQGLPQHFAAARYHSLVVDGPSLPTSLQVTARTSDGTVMGLRHSRYPAEGVQFHPESILTVHGGLLVANFTRSVLRDSHRSRLVAAR